MSGKIGRDFFCDTSALIKLHITEPGRESVTTAAARADAVAVCRIAWAEFHAATARRIREVPIDQSPIERARQQLAADWPRFLVIEVTQAVVETAGEYADAFALRGYDAVQLAAASEVAVESELPVTFGCFDTRLNQAARVLGLERLAVDY